MAQGTRAILARSLPGGFESHLLHVKITVTDILNYYDGVLEFIGVHEGDQHNVLGPDCCYGIATEDSFYSSERSYNIWILPPQTLEPTFQLREEELMWKASFP